mgnify:CR=1 FL=1
MCGRIVCYSPLEDIAVAVDATLDPMATEVYQTSYNIPPSQPLPIACQFESKRWLQIAKWGLLPHWAKDESFGFKTFNARAETIREKPSFKGAFKSRRCLIPINGYYEWQRNGSSKLPYYFSPKNGRILTLAGLFEIWREELLTCTVITTVANEVTRSVHHRMPVIISEGDRATWLKASPDAAYATLKSAPLDLLKMHRVDRAVNNARQEGSELIAPSND